LRQNARFRGSGSAGKKDDASAASGRRICRRQVMPERRENKGEEEGCGREKKM
jgi:hypothetical protein